jgi:uncharacterized protein with von Willebrand factor type A (vWA) domain
VTGRPKHGTRTSHEETGTWQCHSCSSTFVHPTEIDELGPGAWQVELRCAECETRARRVCNAAETDDLDRELELASQEIAAELRRLEKIHMREWGERFVEALRLDLIDADDFRPWTR